LKTFHARILLRRYVRRISLISNSVYLPLLHTLVEERAGVRRLLLTVPLSLSLSPLGGARARYPTLTKEFARR
jgi:hypothetical protein